MSDFLASILGLGFTLVVCLLAVQALLSPWLRVRRSSEPRRPRAQFPSAELPSEPTGMTAQPETTAQIG